MPRKIFYSLVALFFLTGCFDVERISAQTVSRIDIPCKDEKLRLIWDKVKNEFADETEESLAERNIQDCNGLVMVEKVADLNSDGQAEIIIHQTANCPASGNCMFWVFQRNQENDYQAILNADMIQSLKLRRTKTNGFTDIQLNTQNSAASHYYQLFKFDGKKYAPHKCWWEDYMVPDRKGNFHEVKKPRIYFERCGEYDYVNSF